MHVDEPVSQTSTSQTAARLSLPQLVPECHRQGGSDGFDRKVPRPPPPRRTGEVDKGVFASKLAAFRKSSIALVARRQTPPPIARPTRWPGTTSPASSTVSSQDDAMDLNQLIMRALCEAATPRASASPQAAVTCTTLSSLDGVREQRPQRTRHVNTKAADFPDARGCSAKTSTLSQDFHVLVPEQAGIGMVVRLPLCPAPARYMDGNLRARINRRASQLD